MSEAQPVDPMVTIRAETSLVDPDTCKFTVSRIVHPGGPFFFDDRERAAGSPLVERLFAIPGVANVLIVENVVTVGKEPAASWPVLRAQIGGVIRTLLLSAVPAILEAVGTARTWGRSDAELRVVVQDLLDKEINPSIASHGGKISIVDVRDAKLYIAMSGGCQGCGSSQVTLRQGFEVMVHRVTPEIADIIDTTDHAAGKTPFYRSRG